MWNTWALTVPKSVFIYFVSLLWKLFRHSEYFSISRPQVDGVQTSGRCERWNMRILSVEKRKKEGKEALSGRIFPVLQVKEKERHITWAFSPAVFFRDLEDKSRISLNMKSFKLNTIVWYLVKEFNEVLLVRSSYIFIRSTCSIP